MSEIESIAEELFFKLRNRFPNINMGNEDGQATTSPQEARFFNFDYTVDGKKHGKVTCSLIDPQAIKIYYGQEITEGMDETEETSWFQFLRELRKFSKSNMLMFDVRDITKDSLDQKDIEFVSKHMKKKNNIEESRVTWARRGRFSEGNQESIKIHVVHNEKMDENPHNRLSKIDKIYLVNSKGEKFLMPFKSVTGAKVMAHHTAKGGTPYDEGGQVISKAIAEMKNLQRFAMANRNKKFENEQPGKVLTATKHLKEVMRKHLLKMADDRDFDTHLTELAKLVKLDDARANEDIKNWFVQKTYNENLDAWIESAANAYHKYEELQMQEDNDIGDPSPDMTAKRAKDQALVGKSVQLYNDPEKDKEMQELIRKQPMRGMVRLILADIAKRAVDDETAILASKADEGEMTQRHLDMIKSYIKDLYSGNPDRTAPAAKKDIHGKLKTAEEEFESSINNIGEEKCPHCGMDPCGCDDHDHTEESAPKGWEGTVKAMKKHKDIDNPYALTNYMKKKGYHSHKKDESVEEGEGMEAGVCNESPAGTMCPVHGMEECSYGTMEEDHDHGEHTMEDLNNIRRLAGMEEAKPDFLDVDKDGDKEEPMKKALKDKEEKKTDESLSWMMKLAGLNENYIYAQETDEEEAEGEEELEEEGDVEEGNEFSGARADAVAKHQDHFTVGGKTYKVTEVDMSEGEKEEEEEENDEEWHDKDGKRDPQGAHDAGGHYHPERANEGADIALENLKKAAGIW